MVEVDRRGKASRSQARRQKSRLPSLPRYNVGRRTLPYSVVKWDLISSQSNWRTKPLLGVNWLHPHRSPANQIALVLSCRQHLHLAFLPGTLAARHDSFPPAEENSNPPTLYYAGLGQHYCDPSHYGPDLWSPVTGYKWPPPPCAWLELLVRWCVVLHPVVTVPHSLNTTCPPI